MVRVEIVLGDITHEQVDVIVSSASPALEGSDGVESAVRRRGGVAVLDACKRLRDADFPRGAPPAVILPTRAGNLRAAWVFHAVGPDFGTPSAPIDLARCYRDSLQLAELLGASTIAFPAISAGRRGYPVEAAAQVAVRAVRYASSRIDCVRFVLFDKSTYSIFVKAFVGTL